MSQATETTLDHVQAPERTVPSIAARYLLVAYGSAGTRSAELLQGHALVIGRAFPAQLVMEDASLSRQHARFTWLDDGSLEIEDLGSRNGTFVADSLGTNERITRKAIAPLERVVVGSVTCVVYRMESSLPGVAGLHTYDALLSYCGDELLRAREFGRPLSLLALRAVSGSTEARQVGAWADAICKKLRGVDRAAAYDAESLLVLLPESSGQAAMSIAQASIRESGADLRAGVAQYPGAAGSHEKLVAVAQEMLRRATASEPVVVSQASLEPDPLPANGIVVQAPCMIELYEVVKRVAERAVTVLVLGETGTGKEMIASAIHRDGPRATGPLRAINCAAIPASLTESVLFGHERGAFTGAHQSQRGVFEEAHGGSLFLDEIGDLSLPAQAALLRVLETRRVCRVGAQREIEVDVRVIAATHCDLEEMIAQGKFRADLYYRLNTVVLHVPPLRERTQEIVPLAQHLLRTTSAAWNVPLPRLGDDALDCLVAHSFPGNVRELRNLIERALVVCRGPVITAADLTDRVRDAATSKAPTTPPPMAAGADTFLPRPSAAPAVPSSASEDAPEEDGASGPLRDRLRDFEAKLIIDALQQHGGSQVRTAEALGIPLRTLVYKIKSLGIRQAFVRE